ncbi:MAG: glycosyltransferase family 39 protein [Bacteroidales bacterium]|nr:glycosyltransferase family 39 protein [Bacteroidales bacterium]MDD3699994.1 glycosyltransferase family 39 protein [Bacteroidales bacterium]MDY0368766.1 glycosyltransferase family 39 protein [Bacteroidales bacterium]
MRSKLQSIPMKLWLLLLLSAAIRLLLSAWLELSNDEVYYWTYALYPDWSHYDHPPMVGWFIRFFSFNLQWDQEVFIRLASVVCMTFNTYFIYKIGCQLRNEIAGWYAALLYTASVYAFVITGILILPDTPQTLFWILSLWLMIQLLQTEANSLRFRKKMLWLGLSIGLGMLSKYTAVFLWVGLAMYVLLYQRNWLRQPVLYVSVFLSFLIFLPVLFWNITHQFISFSFHGDRINIFESGLRFTSFFQELAGQFLYNNPVNVILIILSLVAIAKKKLVLRSDMRRLIIWTSLPMIGLFLFFSLFRFTLPHWSGPAYSGLLLLAALWLAESQSQKKTSLFFPSSISVSLFLLIAVLAGGVAQIKYGIFPSDKNESYHRIGRHDVSLDMYGWKQLEGSFKTIREKHIALGDMHESDAIIGENWFPLAHLDYYVARPLHMQVFGLGPLHKLHKYHWINELRGGLQIGRNYWYITNSRDYKHPAEIYQDWFKEIVPADTIEIYRAQQPVKRFFVFQLYELQKLPDPF